MRLVVWCWLARALELMLSSAAQDLASVGSKLQQEGKKRKMPELQDFATWIVEQEAPKLLSKEQVRAATQCMPRADCALCTASV